MPEEFDRYLKPKPTGVTTQSYTNGSWTYRNLTFQADNYGNQTRLEPQYIRPLVENFPDSERVSHEAAYGFPTFGIILEGIRSRKYLPNYPCLCRLWR
jgi:hypothetical protein